MASNPNDSIPLRFAGKKVVIADGRDFMRGSLEKLFRTEGAEVAKSVTLETDIVVEHPDKPSAHEKRASDLNKAGKAKIWVVSEKALRASIVPTREETLALLRGDGAARERLDCLLPEDGPSIDVSGESFRGLDLKGVRALAQMNLDDTDLRDSKLAHLPAYGFHNHPERLTRANLDGASFSGGALHAIDCSMKGIRIGSPMSVDVSGSDLTGATLADSHNLGFRYVKSSLRDAKVSKWSFQEAHLESADLTGADLREAAFRNAEARGATFARAILVKAWFSKADLRDADFSGADLTGADFTGADLTGAKVDGATLTDAVFTQAKLDGIDTSKAKGFALPANPFVVGPCITKLETVAAAAKQLESEIRVDLKHGYVTMNIHAYGRYGQQQTATSLTAYYRRSEEGAPGDSLAGNYANSMADAFSAVVARCQEGRIRPDTLKVKSKDSALSGKELKGLFLGAWREALGADAAAADAAVGNAAPSGKELATALLAELRGDDGVKKWNARSLAERTPAGGFRGADLTKAELAGVDFRDLDFQKAKFDGANLYLATLAGCKLAGASFAGANLREADLRRAVLRGASFHGAGLADALFGGTSLFGDGTDLRKVDFTNADLAGAKLGGSIFDETTILPAGFSAPQDMVWRGKTADPRLAAAAVVPAGATKLDADAFVKSLTTHTEKSRMEKTLAMLKADRFKLFVEVNEDRLGGVVKSQTDKELVYACTLAADGSYACCSQNLNPCGGLRGALCKHLLVLVIGLAKGGGIEPGRVDAWIAAGRGRGAALDKDAMTRILLRFKGAEAGEVDWRPMETVPEDYYAM